MTKLDEVVLKVVETYRSVFLVTSIVAFVLTVLQQNWIGLIVLGPLLAISYFVGLYLVGWLLSKMIDPSVMLEELRAKRIAEINRKLDAGELQAESPELEAEMVKAGLKPLNIIVQRGPVFGKQFGAELLEWVDAKEGLNGQVNRYVYVGQAQFEPDGTVITPNDESLFLVLDGVLYECNARTSQDQTVAVVGSDPAV